MRTLRPCSLVLLGLECSGWHSGRSSTTRGGRLREAGAPDYQARRGRAMSGRGLVRDATQASTGLGVNIEEFMSGLQGEPLPLVLRCFTQTARSTFPMASSSHAPAQGARATGGRDHGRPHCGRWRARRPDRALLIPLARLPRRCHKAARKSRVDDDGKISRARVLRRSADGQPAPRQLPRRDPALRRSCRAT